MSSSASSGAAAPAPPATPVRRARAAVSGLFFINAVLYANLVPRLPEVKDRLDLTNASFGAAIAAMPVGALLAGLFAAVLIRRLGSAVIASIGLVLLALGVLAVPYTGAWWSFAAVMLVMGALDSLVDVAQNAHGFRVQRLYRRSIVNAFHGLWSVGAVVGGVMGSLAAGLEMPLTTHLAVTTVLFGALALLCLRYLLRGPEDAERAEASSTPGTAATVGPVGSAGTEGAAEVAAADDRPSARRRLPHGAALRLLAALGALAVFGAFVEDAGASWGALYLRTELASGAAVGGLAFVALQVAMTAGRLTGDRVVDRFGQRTVARAGGALITVGLGAALALPSVATTLVGFALAGLGVATLIPAVMHAADEMPGLPHGVGLTVVSWVLRIGFLLSPPLIGVIADATSLRVGLLVVVVAGVGVLLLSRMLVRGTVAAHPTAPDELR